MAAEIEVLYWRDIPAAVKARGPFATVRVDLPVRFAKAIDEAAAAAGLSGTDQMLIEYRWEAAGKCEGATADCASAAAKTVDKEYPSARLKAMAELSKNATGKR